MAEPADLWAVLESQGAARPGKTAVVILDSRGNVRETATYAELCDRVRARAAWLGGEGLAGARIAVPAATDLEVVASFFAVLAAGGTVVPVNPRLLARPEEGLSRLLADAQPAAVLADAAAAARLAGRLAAGAPPILIPREAGAGAFTPQPAAGVAVIQYTSGSTSDPKGVCVTHANFLANAGMLRAAFGGAEADVAVSWLPLFHDMGLMAGLILPLVLGGATHLISPAAFAARPAVWLKALTAYRGTIAAAPDFAFRHCTENVPAADLAALDLSAWRIAMCGAEPVRAETVEAFIARFAPAGFSPRALIPSYGLAEATLYVTGGPAQGPRILALPDGRRLVACGARAPGTEVAIVGEDGNLAGEGETGEILVAGPGVAAGYFGRPEETAAAFGARLGGRPFLRTGDLGFLRDGQLYVTGRLKDLIIVRGAKLHPADIEAAAEAVAGVRRACAIGVDGPNGEEALAVLIQPASADQALLAEVRGAVNAAFGVDPARIAPVHTLPLTSSGKLRRAAARAMWLAGGIR